MLLRFLIFVVAPAVLMAQAPAAGVKAWSQLETRDCPKPDPADGPAQYACGSGLQGRSGGKTCLWGVQYIDGQEASQYDFRVCTQSCLKEGLKNLDTCTGKVIADYGSGKVTWRSFAALPDAMQKKVLSDYAELIALATAESADPKKYQKLGGDDRRAAVKTEIVNIVMQQMLPYYVFSTDALGGSPKWSESVSILKDFSSAPSGGVVVDGAAPMATSAEYDKLEIFESAFLDKDAKGYRAADVNELAAELIHESIHWTQENQGFGQGRYSALDPMHTAQHMLLEIMAYDRCRISTFYKIVLTPTQKRNLVDTGLGASVVRMKELLGSLGAENVKEIARWAWTTAEMRRMMVDYPGEDGGVWGALCAANKGTGPCGMVINGPQGR